MPYELCEEGDGARVWNTDTGRPLSARPLAPRIAARQRDLLDRLEHDPAWKPQADDTQPELPRPGGAVRHLIVYPHVVHVIAVTAAVHPHVVRAMAAVHVHVARGAARALAALLARKPKISVITPTWQRARLLTGRCIPSVAAQSYDGEIEHVIVSDGPDPELAGVPGVVFLDKHRYQPNRGIWARLEGTRLATGDLIAYLDDDNSWRPDHLELLAAAIEDREVPFAYSRAACHNGNGHSWEVGCAPPVFGQIDTSLIVHRAGLLEIANWEPSPVPADWHLVSRWLAAGARWAHVPEITLDYYANVPLPALRKSAQLCVRKLVHVP